MSSATRKALCSVPISAIVVDPGVRTSICSAAPDVRATSISAVGKRSLSHASTRSASSWVIGARLSCAHQSHLPLCATLLCNRHGRDGRSAVPPAQYAAALLRLLGLSLTVRLAHLAWPSSFATVRVCLGFVSTNFPSRGGVRIGGEHGCHDPPRPTGTDATMTPRQFLGDELKRARVAAGFSSQQALADHLGFDRSVVAKSESGERVPSSDVLTAWAKACNIDTEHYARLADLARTSDGPVPAWFEYWLERERTAHVLRYWSPIIVTPLFETADYRRAVAAWLAATTQNGQTSLLRRLWNVSRC